MVLIDNVINISSQHSIHNTTSTHVTDKPVACVRLWLDASLPGACSSHAVTQSIRLFHGVETSQLQKIYVQVLFYRASDIWVMTNIPLIPS